MKTIMLIALLAAAGCSKKSSDCDAAIAKGMNNLTETIKSRASGPQQEQNLAMLDKIKGVVTKHCNEDKWPAEVVNCMTTVTNQRDMRACQDKLSTEQKQKITTDIQQIMLGSMRMPPGAGHPPGLAGSGASDPGTTGAAPAAPTTEPPTAPPPAAGATPPAPPATPPAPATGSSAAADPAAPAKGGW